jgi:hypothetical protein
LASRWTGAKHERMSKNPSTPHIYRRPCRRLRSDCRHRSRREAEAIAMARGLTLSAFLRQAPGVPRSPGGHQAGHADRAA